VSTENSPKSAKERRGPHPRSPQLARAAGRVVAVEYDPYWATRLEERFLGDENVRVLRADALTVRFPDEPYVVVANIPFNVTTSILHRLLDDPTAPLQSAYLLVQTEVALKHARLAPTTLKTPCAGAHGMRSLRVLSCRRTPSIRSRKSMPA
jgi:hypothetical protein